MTNSSRPRLIAVALFVLATAVYWRTAYPTITWWDSSGYSLAASTLGVASAPGSVLLTIIGWPVAHLPFISSPARALNLLAGLLAALTVVLVYVAALRTLRVSEHDDERRDLTPAATIGAALGALTLAFGSTLWEHAVKFTPYVLTAVFTGLILLTMLRWWEKADDEGASRYLALLGFLFGLDFSVHRTNALLIPAAFVWVLIRRPQTFASVGAWFGSTTGLIAGLAVQLLVIPMSIATKSPWNFNIPDTAQRLWAYESLANRGGGFLLQLIPRKSAVWSVQIMDFIRVLGANFVHLTGSVGVLGVLPLVAAVFGLAVLLRRNRRLGIAFALVGVVQAAMTVLYFNIPANFFRTFDRHYLPVCVTIAVLVALGLGAFVQWLATKRLAAIAVALAVVVPSAQLVMNWTARDASNRYFAGDYARNALEPLPKNAIYFTVGDNDTYPVLYMQVAEHVRPDVRIVNVSSMGYPTFAQQMLHFDPTFPIAPVIDTTSMPRVESTMRSIVDTNRSKRPLTFAVSGGRGTMDSLAIHSRLEGIYWRILPADHPRVDLDSVRARMLERYNYRGYADASVRIDDDATRAMAFQYYTALNELLRAEHEYGTDARCRDTVTKMFAAVPPERVSAPAGFRKQMEMICGVAP